MSVGVFILIGIICVGYLTIKLGQMEILGSDTYTLNAQFLSVAGLKTGASVEMAGVQVGQVDSITLDLESRMAVVQLKINNDLKLSDDVIASVKTAGLIGDKYISLSPGGSDIVLNPGDRILDTESAVDLEALISKYVFGGV
jgi:phospholipid/cholesterol/gamma-HCH transport system substrate-binding protein